MGIRVLVVEDQPKILKAQIKLLETFDEIEIVGEALSGESALELIDSVNPRSFFSTSGYLGSAESMLPGGLKRPTRTSRS